MNTMLVLGAVAFVVLAATINIFCKFVPFLKIKRLEKAERRALAKKNWFRGFICLALSFLLAIPASYGFFLATTALSAARKSLLLQNFEHVVIVDDSLWVFPSLIMGLHLGALLGHLFMRFILGNQKFTAFMNFQDQASGFKVVRFSILWGMVFQLFCLYLMGTLYFSGFASNEDKIILQRLGKLKKTEYSYKQVEDLRCFEFLGNTKRTNYCEIQFIDKEIYRFFRPSANIAYIDQRDLLDSVSIHSGVRLNFARIEKAVGPKKEIK